MTKIRVDVGPRVYSLETEDPGPVEDGLRAIGFAPSVPGRRLLVGNSGVVFTTGEARTWLLDQGYDVPPNGRLADHWLHLYAERH